MVVSVCLFQDVFLKAKRSSLGDLHLSPHFPLWGIFNFSIISLLKGSSSFTSFASYSDELQSEPNSAMHP